MPLPPAHIVDRTSSRRPALLNDGLVDLLDAASRAERVTSGLARRRAFRCTRVIIGALLQSGYSADAIAQQLGIRADSVRFRRENDGLLSAADVFDITARTPEHLELTPTLAHAGPVQGVVYRALDLIAALT